MLAAKWAETFSKPLITLIFTDGWVELVREKERSHNIPDLAFQVYPELRDWFLEKVHENAPGHGLRKKRLCSKLGIEEKLQFERLLLCAGGELSVFISEDQW